MLREMLYGAFIGLFLSGSAWGYEEASVGDGGALKGSIRYSGTLPSLSPIPVKKHQDVCGSSKLSEALVVGQNNGVGSSVVLVEGVRSVKKAGKEVVIDNHTCAVVPHVAAVMVGGKVTIKNSDDMFHNIHGFLGKSTVFNIALPRQHQQIDISSRLKRPGVVEVVCDAHTHMRGWLLVHDSPYFAVTDQHGNFVIDGIPPGKYKITMWHESWVEKGREKDGRVLYGDPLVTTKEVTIQPNGIATVEFELKSFNPS